MEAHQLVNLGRLPVRRQQSRSGNAILELSLTITALLPLLFGVAGVGTSLGRAVQATQITRDAAHMYGLGADMSNTGTQGIIRQLGSNWNMTGSGNAVIIFSRIVKVFATDCTVAGVSCNNQDQYVFSERIAMGNTGLRSSNYGTPPSSYLDTGGDIAPNQYMTQLSLRANGFNLVDIGQGQNAYLTEAFYNMPDLTFLGARARGFYVRFVY